MALHGRKRLTAGIGLGVAALALPLVAGIGAAAAAGPAQSARTAVAGDSGITKLPGVTQLGNTAGSTPETVSFVLKERNEGALASAVAHGLKKFITTAQFASTYGQTAGNIDALEKFLAKYGIKSSAMANGIDVVTHGTVAEYNAALGVHQATFRVPATAAANGLAARPAQVIHAATGPASLPGNIASYVTAVLGLSNYAGFSSQAIHTPTAKAARAPHASGVNCVQQIGVPDGCNLPQNFASNYGLTGVHATGKGQTIAIVTLAAMDPTGPSYFWKNIAKITRTGTLKTINIDGGPGAPNFNNGSSETDLDTEQSGGLAPGANVIVYQAPNTDPGFVDAFFEAATQNVASTISASWGESETIIKAAVLNKTETAGYRAAFDEAFLEMAAQGQSSFVSTGDEGAYTAARDLGSTNLSVGSPADSPYTTAAGGTTLPYTANLGGVNVTVKAQRAWGWDYLWHAIAVLNGVSYYTAATKDVVGGTGGFSVDYPTPAYQSGVSGTNDFHAFEYLTPTGAKTYAPGLVLPDGWKVKGSPKLVTGKASGRAVPDVSADADPETGYALYAPSATGVGGTALQYGWGGTSFVAPQLNGSTAVIDSALGHRVGFWNAAIYKFATSKSSPFTTISSASSSNDILYYSGNPGQVYNPATGLGLPNFTKLAASFKAYGF